MVMGIKNSIFWAYLETGAFLLLIYPTIAYGHFGDKLSAIFAASCILLIWVIFGFALLGQQGYGSRYAVWKTLGIFSADPAIRKISLESAAASDGQIPNVVFSAFEFPPSLVVAWAIELAAVFAAVLPQLAFFPGPARSIFEIFSQGLGASVLGFAFLIAPQVLFWVINNLSHQYWKMPKSAFLEYARMRGVPSESIDKIWKDFVAEGLVTED